MKKIILTFCLLLIAISCSEPTSNENSWGKYFTEEKVRGCIILSYPKNNQKLYYNRKRSFTRFSPAETFDILNSLIALETRVLKSHTNDTLIFPGPKYDNPLWNKDQNLVSAYKNSCPWFYKEVARLIGGNNMTKFVDSIDCYGTMNRIGEVEVFWNDGSFEISNEQQIQFLERLYNNDLPFSKENLNIVKKFMLDYKDNIRVIRSKIAVSRVHKVIWFIGWIEYKNVPCFFALNISYSDEKDIEKAKQSAKTIVKRILVKRKILDENTKWN